MRTPEEFVTRLMGVLYTSPGWESPLTKEQLYELLQTVLDEWHQEQYGGVE